MRSSRFFAASSWSGLSRGDVLLTAGLALGLSAALVVDVAAYHRQQTQGMVDPDFALLELRSSVFIGNSQFLPAQAKGSVRLDNFGPIEGHHITRYRHGLGPVSTIEIYSERKHAHLDLQYINHIPDQELIIRCNETVLEHFTALPVGSLSRTYQLSLRPGCNRFTVSYARYNHAGSDYAPTDARPLAGAYTLLNLFLD